MGRAYHQRLLMIVVNNAEYRLLWLLMIIMGHVVSIMVINDAYKWFVMVQLVVKSPSIMAI